MKEFRPGEEEGEQQEWNGEGDFFIPSRAIMKKRVFGTTKAKRRQDESNKRGAFLSLVGRDGDFNPLYGPDNWYLFENSKVVGNTLEFGKTRCQDGKRETCLFETFPLRGSI